MFRQEAINQYHEALKAGKAHYKNSLIHGRYPFPQVLDEILDDTMIAGRVDLGIIEIPTEQITGTKTQGRQNAFAANFMPLLPDRTEFALKWINLCCDHLSDVGIRDPIRCYEYLGRFYVLEGNKRVSVLKSFGAPTIPGHVIRLVPTWSEDPEVQRYYEFLDAYRLTGLYRVHFTQPGSFPRLQAALGYDADHKWSDDECRRFLSGFSYFQEAFQKLGGNKLPLSVADAMLVWLKFYTFEELRSFTSAELSKSLTAVWPDIKVLSQAEPIAVSTAPEETEEDKSILSRLVDRVFPARMAVAFVNELDPTSSPWVRSHEQGIRYLEETMGERINILVYNGVGSGESAENAMEQAIAEGAQVVFATTVSLISVCRKVAVRHPNIRILNCSTVMPYTGVRTYYSRIYEGKFLSGAIAGAMSGSDHIGYIASSPIFGVPAGINAFALGARLTNPRAKIKLMWSCLPGDPIQELIRQGVDYISTLDMPTLDYLQDKRGAYQVQPDGNLHLLASPLWNWGEFYVKLVNSILNGGWDTLSSGKEEQAVNYWWGMASGVIDLWLSPDLPEGVQNLVQILQKGIIDGSISPFHRRIRAQDGTLHNNGERWFTPEEIVHMDWLCDIVDGSIPSFDELIPKAQAIVRLQGIYRDQIPPEKEGLLL